MELISEMMVWGLEASNREMVRMSCVLNLRRLFH
jgi:hypothetical protein